MIAVRWRVDVSAGVWQALATLRARPLRAALAGLAMAAAVAATAVIVTTLDGLADSARRTSARAFGSNTFIIAKVFGSGLSRKALADKQARNPNITRTDLRFLERYGGGTVDYAAIAQRAADVSAGGRTFENAAVNGASATLSDIRDVGIERGRFFTRAEEERAAQVAVVGRSVADTLFPSQDPIGATIRIGGRGFTIVGVQARQGTAGGVSLDRYAWIPYPTYERVFGSPESLQVFARATDLSRERDAEDRAHASMRARRLLRPGQADNFDLLTPDAAREFVARVTERVGAAGPPIALMALFAAFIVVANTTLVSVTERTRDIGLRRALGATARQVLIEVLSESLMVALVGGVVGLGVAAVLLNAAARVFDVPLALDSATVFVSVGSAAASGLLAGWYPARRASTLDIVDALHAE